MLSPYDWQESISQRGEYIEQRLRFGSPIVGLSIEEGVLLYTYRKNVRKVYEVYDCIMFSAMGQQADVEALRIAAVDFAHREGFMRSEHDVTGGRIVGFALSTPLRQAFGDLTTTPRVVRAVFAELSHAPENDHFFRLEYDGDFQLRHHYCVAAGSHDREERMMELLGERYSVKHSIEQAISLAEEAWRVGADLHGTGTAEASLVTDARPEAGFLERSTKHDRRFRVIELK
ncbi:MAG: hypothetical protein C4341_01885 [Armatimonadota bacterium]